MKMFLSCFLTYRDVGCREAFTARSESKTSFSLSVLFHLLDSNAFGNTQIWLAKRHHVRWFTTNAIGLWVSWVTSAIKAALVKIELLHPNVIILKYSLVIAMCPHRMADPDCRQPISDLRWDGKGSNWQRQWRCAPVAWLEEHLFHVSSPQQPRVRVPPMALCCMISPLSIPPFLSTLKPFYRIKPPSKNKKHK